MVARWCRTGACRCHGRRRRTGAAVGAGGRTARRQRAAARRSTSDAAPPVRGIRGGASDKATGSGSEPALGWRPPPALTQNLPAVTGQRDVRTAAQPVQGAGVPQPPHPGSVLLRPAGVALTAVEQDGSAHRGAAPQVVRDDPAQLGQQRVAVQPAVGGGGAPRERRARPQAFVRVEHGDDRGRRTRTVPGVQSADDLARTAQQRDSRGRPLRRLEHTVGGCGGRRQRSRRGRSESEGHGPPFGYAHTAGGSDSGERARNRALPGRRASRAGASLNSSCRTWMRQRAIGTGDRYRWIRG
ncbi:hypothetical protein RKD39_001765 [Streptomyces albogriseolus]